MFSVVTPSAVAVAAVVGKAGQCDARVGREPADRLLSPAPGRRRQGKRRHGEGESEDCSNLHDSSRVGPFRICNAGDDRSGERKAFVERLHLAVQLLLVQTSQDLSHPRAWFDAELEQVAALARGRRRTMFDAESARAFEKALDRRAVERARRP